jgi:hypothetical protein
VHGGEKCNGRERDAPAIFKDLGGEVFKDSRCVNGGLRADAKVVLSALFRASVGTANKELEPR